MEAAPIKQEDHIQVRFAVTATTLSGEHVFLSGNCPELGTWMPSGAVMLSKEDPALDSAR